MVEVFPQHNYITPALIELYNAVIHQRYGVWVGEGFGAGRELGQQDH